MADIRNMTDAELDAFYERGHCPFCANRSFLSGPRGGLMQNIECGGCGARLNIFPEPVLGYPAPRVGQVIRERVRP